MCFSREFDCVVHSGAGGTVCYRQCVDSFWSCLHLECSKTTWRMDLECPTDRTRDYSPPRGFRPTVLPAHFRRAPIPFARAAHFCRFVDNPFRIASALQTPPSRYAMYITGAVPVRRTRNRVSSERTFCECGIDAVDQRFSVSRSNASHNYRATNTFWFKDLRDGLSGFRNAPAEYAILQPLPGVANFPSEGRVSQLRPYKFGALWGTELPFTSGLRVRAELPLW